MRNPNCDPLALTTAVNSLAVVVRARGSQLGLVISITWLSLCKRSRRRSAAGRADPGRRKNSPKIPLHFRQNLLYYIR